jgi:hypothetical protein
MGYSRRVVARSASRVVLAGAAASMLLLAHCASFGEARPSLPDADADASAGDGSADDPLDGSRDDSNDGSNDGAGGGRFCDRADRKAASFCSDFDDDGGAASSFGWEEQPALDGLAFSPPRSARITLDPGTHSCAYAGMRKGIARAGARSAHVELAVRLGDAVGQPPFTANVLQLNFNGLSNAETCALFLTASSSGTSRVWEQDVVSGQFIGTGSVDIPKLVAPWAQVAIDVVLSTTPPTFSVAVDGKPIGTAQMRNECQAPATEVELNVGFRCYDGTVTSPLHVRFDDVLVDVTGN